MTLISDILATFYVATTTGAKYLWWPDTVAAMPLAVPGAWYDLTFTHQLTNWVAGTAVMVVEWYDVDGNLVRLDYPWNTAAVDAAAHAGSVFAKAPVHASRVRIRFGASAGSSLTVYFSAITFRRCPQRLIVVADNADGTLADYSHPVHVTVKSVPRWEIARGA